MITWSLSGSWLRQIKYFSSKQEIKFFAAFLELKENKAELHK
jgi:hypothetical protein